MKQTNAFKLRLSLPTKFVPLQSNATCLAQGSLQPLMNNVVWSHTLNWKVASKLISVYIASERNNVVPAYLHRLLFARRHNFPLDSTVIDVESGMCQVCITNMPSHKDFWLRFKNNKKSYPLHTLIISLLMVGQSWR